MEGHCVTHRCTDDFKGTQLKGVCVEAGMIALRRKAEELFHKEYTDGIMVSICLSVCLSVCPSLSRVRYGSNANNFCTSPLYSPASLTSWAIS